MSQRGIRVEGAKVFLDGELVAVMMPGLCSSTVTRFEDILEAQVKLDHVTDVAETNTAVILKKIAILESELDDIKTTTTEITELFEEEE